ncbi:MAG: amidohydrolase [Clostridiales bacterium]|nr:amidohydrolase [Clostridiales bacterium]
MIIDVQHHALPRKVFEKFHDPSLPPKPIAIRYDSMFTFAPRLCDLDEHVQMMDDGGVDMALLSVSQFGNIMGKEICREINEEFAEEIARFPGRFAISGCFPQDDPDAAVEEIEYLVKELKYPAVSMITSITPEITLSNKEYMWPIYEKIAELDIPVFVHPNIKPFGAEPECTIAASLSRGYDGAKAAMRLIYDVLPAFPNIKFVLPHFGGALLALKGRALNFYQPPAELGLPPVKEKYRNLSKSPLESAELGHDKAFNDVFDKLYIDGAGSAGWPPITEMAFRCVKHDHLLWATDYPYETHEGRDFRYYIDSLDQMDISEEDKKAFLGGNAARLLKLEK